MVLEWRNHLDVRRFMLSQHEISPAEHQAWFARSSTEKGRSLLIAEIEGVPLGFVNFKDVGPDETTEWGFYAAPSAPKGSGRKFGTAALEFVFGELNVHKVCGRALDFNVASIHFHERLGFKREGALREQVRIGGTYHDMICFGILAAEWAALTMSGH